MAKNCVRHPANNVPFTAPSGGVVSGVPLMIGALFVVPSIDADEGESFEGQLTGEWEFTKATADVVTEGQAAYFDGTVVTTADGAGANALIGAFTEARANGDTLAHVRLNGIAAV
jgi:predicted RecA/RadA family phage recombinase